MREADFGGDACDASLRLQLSNFPQKRCDESPVVFGFHCLIIHK